MFWDIFYNLCIASGTKPNAVCKELDLSNATATHWKNGTMPKGDALIKIADYFGCSVDYLLGRTESPNTIIETCIKGNNNGIQAIKGDVHINTTKENEKKGNFTKEFINAFESLDLSDKVDVINFVFQKIKSKNQ